MQQPRSLGHPQIHVNGPGRPVLIRSQSPPTRRQRYPIRWKLPSRPETATKVESGNLSVQPFPLFHCHTVGVILSSSTRNVNM
ncbi:hypothetical protein VTK73DRAFT_5113 [Phialemonium thermophilum]|uniref:Uncharacterized protein n=1 Tax=Phialemonium thermophilum TaxID=223376 RepID=A0ABR3WQ25_9PEZI